MTSSRQSTISGRQRLFSSLTLRRLAISIVGISWYNYFKLTSADNPEYTQIGAADPRRATGRFSLRLPPVKEEDEEVDDASGPILAAPLPPYAIP